MSNNTRANCRIFSGKFASLPERFDDFAIDKSSKGDKGLLPISLGAHIARWFPYGPKRLATKTLFKQVQRERLAMGGIVIADLLAPRTGVAIMWTRGIRSVDLDMRAVVLRVVTIQTELADNAVTVTATALVADIGDRLLATVSISAGAWARGLLIPISVYGADKSNVAVIRDGWQKL